MKRANLMGPEFLKMGLVFTVTAAGGAGDGGSGDGNDYDNDNNLLISTGNGPTMLSAELVAELCSL
jgi:hypothetical protein